MKDRHDFLSAAAEGDLERVKALLLEGVDLNMIDKNNTTALHFAAWNGRSETAVYLLRKGINVKAAEGDGWTAIHDAIRKENSDMLLTILHEAFELDEVSRIKKELYNTSNNRDKHFLELLRLANRYNFRLDAIDIEGSNLLADAEQRKYQESVVFIKDNS